MADPTMRGSCLCGAVVFEFERVIGPFEMCHCPRCRKVTGAAYLPGLRVEREGFRYLSGAESIRSFALPVREQPPPYTTSFCCRCGSPTPPAEPEGESLEIPAGLLDSDPACRPDRHIYVEHQAPWFEFTDELPKLDRDAVWELRGFPIQDR